MALTPSNARGSRVSVRLNGVNYVLGTLTDITPSRTAGTTNTEEVLSGETLTTTTAAPPPTLTMNIVHFQPYLPENRLMQAALDAGTSLPWSFVKNEVGQASFPATARAAIATDGIVTFSGTGAPTAEEAKQYARGMCLRLDGTPDVYYMIDNVTDAGVVTAFAGPGWTSGPATAIAATQLNSVVVPRFTSTFNAPLASFESFGVYAAGTSVTSSIEIAPSANLPLMSISLA